MLRELFKCDLAVAVEKPKLQDVVVCAISRHKGVCDDVAHKDNVAWQFSAFMLIKHFLFARRMYNWGFKTSNLVQLICTVLTIS